MSCRRTPDPTWFLLTTLLGLGLSTPLQAQEVDHRALEPVATISLQWEQSERKAIPAARPLFGHYLGTGSGEGTRALGGSVTWDLYEDQSHDDFHPAHLHGVLEQDGRRHSFQILGVFTPFGRETVVTPDGKTNFRFWSLTGTIVVEEAALLGATHANITGRTDLAHGGALYTVWGGAGR